MNRTDEQPAATCATGFELEACYNGLIFQFLQDEDVAMSLLKANSIDEYFWLRNLIALSLGTRLRQRTAPVLTIMLGDLYLVKGALVGRRRCTMTMLADLTWMPSAFYMRYMLDNMNFGMTASLREATKKKLLAAPRKCLGNWPRKQIVSEIAHEFVGSPREYMQMLRSYGGFTYYMISTKVANARTAQGYNYVGTLIRNRERRELMSCYTRAINAHHGTFDDVDGKGHSAAQMFADNCSGMFVTIMYDILAILATSDLSRVRTIDGKCTVLERITGIIALPNLNDIFVRTFAVPSTKDSVFPEFVEGVRG